MEQGLVPQASFSLSGPLSDPVVALDFAFTDAVARPLPPLPPVTGDGWGRLTERDFSLTLAEGAVVVPGAAGGEIALDGSSFLLDTLSDPDIPARITVLGTGPLPAILSLIEGEPLGLLARVPLKPGDVGGTGSVNAALSVPLLEDLALEQVGVEATATLRDATLTLAPLRPDLLVEAPRLALEADATRLAMRGDLRLAGSRLAVVWEETFDPGPDGLRSRLQLDGPLDLAGLGLTGLPQGIALDAPVPMALTLTRGAAAGTGFALAADLTGTGLEAVPLGWAKQPGTAARLRASGRLTSAGTRIDTLTLDAGDLSLRGGAGLEADGTLRHAEISRLTIGTATDIRVSLTQADELLRATVSGARLDLGALLETEAPETGSASVHAPGTPLTVEMDIDSLGLGQGRTLRPARGTLERSAAGAVTAMLEGSMGGAAPAALRITLSPDGQGDVSLTSPDAGGLLREVGLARRAIGGRMAAEAVISREKNGKRRFRGTAEINDLVVIEDGALDAMLTRADLDTALATLKREGIRFDRVRLPFEWFDGQIRLHGAVAHGPVVGLTLSGNYHLAADKLNMAGVFTPLYGLSSAIGRVPLIGTLLTGGEGQGLIAFTFDLAGSAADPVISINPLSALLPGVLRQIVQPRPAPG
jgi:hypothetical protein